MTVDIWMGFVRGWVTPAVLTADMFTVVIHGFDMEITVLALEATPALDSLNSCFLTVVKILLQSIDNEWHLKIGVRLGVEPLSSGSQPDVLPLN